MKTVLSMRNVSVSFAGQVAVRHIDLDLPEAGITVLVGRSGSGKTTLLRAVNRLNDEFPASRTTGSLRLDLGNGLEAVYGPQESGIAAPRPVTDLRRRVGMVFQTPNVLPVSVYRNVALPLEWVAHCPREALHKRVEAALAQVGLKDEVALHATAESLSGGQQQRLCLARALALEPSMLLLDEPTASLDVHAAHKVEEVLLQLAEQRPLLLVSHSLAQALRLGQRILVMEGGSLRRQFLSVDGLDTATLAAEIGGESQGIST